MDQAWMDRKRELYRSFNDAMLSRELQVMSQRMAKIEKEKDQMRKTEALSMEEGRAIMQIIMSIQEERRPKPVEKAPEKPLEEVKPEPVVKVKKSEKAAEMSAQ